MIRKIELLAPERMNGRRKIKKGKIRNEMDKEKHGSREKVKNNY